MNTAVNDPARTPRVVACLDVQGGRVVKGTEFVDLQDQGDPLALAARAEATGADEIVFLDIAGTRGEERAAFLELVRRAACTLSVPVAVGGGVRGLEDVERALDSGAAKVAIGSAIVRRPALLDEAAARFGDARIVASIDAKRTARDPAGFEVFTGGGQEASGLEAVAWAVECARRGAGEILLTSIDRDGRRDGFDLELTRQVANAVRVPVVASGGAGSAEHFRALFRETRAAAGLAAGIFHDGTTTPAAVRRLLSTAAPARGGSDAA